MKRILATLAAAASIAGLTLGAAGTANAELAPPPSPIYVSEVSTADVTQQYIEIATASAVPFTLNTDVPIEVTFAGKTLPFTIPAGATFAPGTGWVIAFAGTNLPCADEIRPEILPVNSPIQVRLIGQASYIFESATIPFYTNPMFAQHRTKLTPATFGPAPKSPCQFPHTPSATPTPPPSPLYVNEVSTADVTQQYIEIATASAVPFTLTSDVTVEATFSPDGVPVTLPFTIPANATFGPGTGYVIAFASATLSCANEIRSEILPADRPIRVRLVTGFTTFESATIPFYTNPMFAQHRTKLTPATFKPAPKSPCQFPFTPPTV
ncbi:hypothetical protein DMH04_41050 [Kibdelosporangium aridum]|uniref:Uncharacterized protein n=1 Tax=Kibdelosporangium aridum TaxID=2030 RepID=A0A428YV78_KIBAR|nr:hypothetical protein [Kibdelosporangium aridum]RSM73687.1 hypothetical protein DMH04_41050 [Kibdelosporangium aridum]